MRCALLFTIAIIASYCVLEAFSYKIKLGPNAQKASKDALPKLLKQIGCDMKNKRPDILIGAYDKYKDGLEIYTFKQPELPFAPIYVVSAKNGKVSTIVFSDVNFNTIAKINWSNEILIESNTQIKRPFTEEQTGGINFECPGLTNFEKKAKEVNHKMVDKSFRGVPGFQKYYAIKYKLDKTCANYYLLYHGNVAKFTEIYAVEMNALCKGGVASFDQRIVNAVQNARKF